MTTGLRRWLKTRKNSEMISLFKYVLKMSPPEKDS